MCLFAIIEGKSFFLAKKIKEDKTFIECIFVTVEGSLVFCCKDDLQKEIKSFKQSSR
jgi:hypothetical protein